MAIRKELDLFANSDNTLRLVNEGTVLSIAGWSLRFELRVRASDVAALISAEATITSAPTGLARVDLTAAQMAIAPGRYPFKVLRTDSGNVVVAWGTATVHE
jgi:hypothetical protein